MINYNHSKIRPVQIGDRYEWECDVETRSGHVIPKGSIVEVVGSTIDIPYGDISESKINWICKASNGTTVWATLEQCISRYLLRRIE